MNFFSDSVNRLKHSLRVSKDQEVAAFLGLSKTAFAERKRRQAFPARELLELCESRPELKLNYEFILHGEPKPQETYDEFEGRFVRTKKMAAIINALPLSDQRKSRMTIVLTGDPIHDASLIADSLAAEPLLPSDEQLLLDTYRRCAPQARANLIQTAALLSAGMAAPAENLRAQAKANKPGPRITIGTLNGEQVVGDMTIHGNMHFGRAAAPPPDPSTKPAKPLKKQP